MRETAVEKSEDGGGKKGILRDTPRGIFKNLNNILLYYRGWGESKGAAGGREERVVG